MLRPHCIRRSSSVLDASSNSSRPATPCLAVNSDWRDPRRSPRVASSTVILSSSSSLMRGLRSRSRYLLNSCSTTWTPEELEPPTGSFWRRADAARCSMRSSCCSKLATRRFHSDCALGSMLKGSTPSPSSCSCPNASRALSAFSSIKSCLDRSCASCSCTLRSRRISSQREQRASILGSSYLPPSHSLQYRVVRSSVTFCHFSHTPIAISRPRLTSAIFPRHVHPILPLPPRLQPCPHHIGEPGPEKRKHVARLALALGPAAPPVPGIDPGNCLLKQVGQLLHLHVRPLRRESCLHLLHGSEVGQHRGEIVNTDPKGHRSPYDQDGDHLPPQHHEVKPPPIPFGFLLAILLAVLSPRHCWREVGDKGGRSTSVG
eukprot:Hpha_TRINITY_DN15900_c0_g17::TRINITY_DN15900_c0_g17_i1::g.73780::m.73780